MNNKGFTLVELLAVIVILGIVAVIASVSMFSILEDGDYELFEAKKEVVLVSAELYGQDNRIVITDLDEKGIRYIEVEITDLIEKKYLEASDDCDGITCLKNDITDINMAEDKIKIYIENNRVYAKFVEPIKSCTGSNNENLCINE